MLGLDYIHWEDYYKKDFLPKYEAIKSSAQNCTYSELQEFVETACNLMKYYVWNNGEFYFNKLTIIRKCFRLGIITYGDFWAKIITKKINQHNKQRLLEYALVENLAAIDELKKGFEVLINE